MKGVMKIIRDKVIVLLLGVVIIPISVLVMIVYIPVMWVLNDLSLKETFLNEVKDYKMLLCK